ncbi:DUF3347 domain-containing protein [Pontibacter sp. E15-1]|uniref:DUF3347 domain-containing protein n=1 Tax=Pontibacter sp. E15-1 TaxID=2919918 RepID=UPI001F50037B|nr:DUF3347 domain-containing protein [Pontibacter sp. E15-1]MCJ8167124.1 DUF3347 domain-containing protein [Pontibacter sp. E15-1]
MSVAIILLAFMTACGNGQQETAEKTENMGMADGMESMGNMDGIDMMQQENGVAAVSTAGEPAFVVAYIGIKNALVTDNYEQVKQAASDMQKGLEGSELTEAQRNQLRESASQIADAQDIAAQRQAFAQLSRQLYEVVKSNEVSGKTLYWQHCPMALGGQGANWLSFEEKVSNPFMGQKMPGCGSVEETL